MLNMSYAELIKAFREGRKLTHQQFGDAVGVSRGAVQQWENAVTAPSRKNLPHVARYMGISEGDLMSGGSTGMVVKPLKQADKTPNHQAPTTHATQKLLDQFSLSVDAVRLARWFDGIPEGLCKARAFAECMGRINEWMGIAEQTAARDATHAADTSSAESPAQPVGLQMPLKTNTGQPGR